jgi:UDP-2,4-diacetamido-2,4,6-trideoxy-beta-L-altropyranose hydrolase
MNIAFRVDASRQIGTGHFMRCLTLADALLKRGCQTLFLCRHLPGRYQELLAARNHDLIRLTQASETEIEDTLPHSAWLGTSQRSDAIGCVQALADRRYSWLVVDHYALDVHWESALRESVGNILVIDDLADRKHDCDLLLDQNLVPDMHKRWEQKTAGDCILLVGPQYSLLQPHYAELHKCMLPRKGPIKRIFVYFGGADAENLTARVLSAFLNLNPPNVTLDVVMPPDTPHFAGIRLQINGHSNVRLHENLPSLALLISEADLAIGAAGATSWERLCLGLPSLIVPLSDNQKPIALELAQRGLAVHLGSNHEVGVEDIMERLEHAISAGSDEATSARCLAAVDGCGVARVMDFMLNTGFEIRHARESDSENIFLWRNHPDVRQASINNDLISWEEHQEWFSKVLASQSRHLLIGQRGGCALGVIRFDINNGAAEVSIYRVPGSETRGTGKRLLREAEKWLAANRSDVTVLEAEVLQENKRSKALFLRSGYLAKASRFYKKLKTHG